MNRFRAKHLDILPGPGLGDPDIGEEFLQRVRALCVQEAARVQELACQKAQDRFLEDVLDIVATAIATVNQGHIARSVLAAEQFAADLPRAATERAALVREAIARFQERAS